MRVGIFVVSASVAGAGMAFAQSDWVVDPWYPSAAAPTAVQRAHEAAAAAPQRGRRQTPVEWIDERNLELVDPWSRPAAAAIDSSGAVPTVTHKRAVKPRAASESRDWAKPVPLLVDPWASEPTKSAPPADLIVDPWL